MSQHWTFWVALAIAIAQEPEIYYITYYYEIITKFLNGRKQPT
ncbi:MAG: hypothetical protein RMY28_028220 [Nostoc sp. ChiSLP01]|nr:hypothetical protein [Nostoc sp. CmiSLP01]MDZ8283036.1 hypothetical protein [Nostoc sp. ChiSLP01]